MADLLVRGVSETVLAQIDQRASSLGLSRVEFVRRTLERAVQPSQVEVSLESFMALADVFQDLKDEALMEQAWR
jgi:hypothetical protein